MTTQLDAPVASQRRGVPGRTASTSTTADPPSQVWCSRSL